MNATMADVRAAKMCSRGARVFLKRHGYDWGTFLREGAPCDFLLATGDAMAADVVKAAYERQQKTNRRL